MVAMISYLRDAAYQVEAHFGWANPGLGFEHDKDPNKHLKRPIQVNFEIPYFTVSGLQVRYMKIIEKSNYEAVPWVRYITKNGEYNIRII